MGRTKAMMDEVASRMEISDPNDPRVLAEVGRLLSLDERRLIVLETHPNSGGCWVGKMGTETEILQYLAQLAKDGTLDYVGDILELKNGAQAELLSWIELEDFQPVKVHIRPPKPHSGPTPPLPGLEKRLAGIEAEAYGVKKSVWSILQGMYDQEIEDFFSDALEGMLQSGRAYLCPKCQTPMKMASQYDENCHFVGGIRAVRREGTLGEWWICTNPDCEDGQKNDHSIRISLLPKD